MSNSTAFCSETERRARVDEHIGLELTITTNESTNSSAHATLWLLGLSLSKNSAYAVIARDKGDDARADPVGRGGRALHRALEVSRTLTKKKYGSWREN